MTWDLKAGISIATLLQQRVKREYLIQFFGSSEIPYLTSKTVNEFLLWYKAQRIKEVYLKYLSDGKEPGPEYVDLIIQIEDEIRDLVQAIKRIVPEFKYIEDEE